ncbi:hypothetical protein BDV93DRAFT_362885 [Ceratobasidium sp. AG-I]|nr:hypothetical protein BDV93DRAFT_362885 [Ceratobasidium sp. AG-I]
MWGSADYTPGPKQSCQNGPIYCSSTWLRLGPVPSVLAIDGIRGPSLFCIEITKAALPAAHPLHRAFRREWGWLPEMSARAGVAPASWVLFDSP